MFRLSLKSLSLFFRQVGSMLDAGVPLRRALGTVERVGRGRMRRIAQEIVGDLETGSSFAESIERRGRAFPLLARRLVRVGEQAGALDEVLKSLADFFEMMRSLYRRVLGKMALPLFQYYAAVAVVAGAAWLRQTFVQASLDAHDMTAPGPGGSPASILLIGWGLPPALYAAYLLLTRALGGARAVHEAVLRLPGAGRVARAFALGRFSWCMALCSDAGMGVHDALTFSLEGTGNAAFAGRADRAAERLRAGGRVSDALSDIGLFPAEYLEIVSVAEESGKMAETFRHQAEQHFENARMGASALGMIAAGVVWVAVAAFIIYMIFSFAAGYLQMLSL